nr:unnamed protein product [Callosobruchus chinensis]
MTKTASIARNSFMVVAWVITIVLRREKNVDRLTPVNRRKRKDHAEVNTQGIITTKNPNNVCHSCMVVVEATATGSTAKNNARDNVEISEDKMSVIWRETQDRAEATL